MAFGLPALWLPCAIPHKLLRRRGPVSLGSVPGSGTAGSVGSDGPCEDLPRCVHSGCARFHSGPQGVRVSVSQHLASTHELCIVAKLLAGKWHLVVILTWLPWRLVTSRFLLERLQCRVWGEGGWGLDLKNCASAQRRCAASLTLWPSRGLALWWLCLQACPSKSRLLKHLERSLDLHRADGCVRGRGAPRRRSRCGGVLSCTSAPPPQSFTAMNSAFSWPGTHSDSIYLLTYLFLPPRGCCGLPHSVWLRPCTLVCVSENGTWYLSLCV